MLDLPGLRIEVPDVSGYDFRVSMVNNMDIGFDADVLTDRLASARSALAYQCGSVVLVDESQIMLGTYPTGRKRIIYVMRLKCLRV